MGLATFLTYLQLISTAASTATRELNGATDAANKATTSLGTAEQQLARRLGSGVTAAPSTRRGSSPTEPITPEERRRRLAESGAGADVAADQLLYYAGLRLSTSRASDDAVDHFGSAADEATSRFDAAGDAFGQTVSSAADGLADSASRAAELLDLLMSFEGGELASGSSTGPGGAVNYAAGVQWLKDYIAGLEQNERAFRDPSKYRATSAGGLESLSLIFDRFFGDRFGRLEDLAREQIARTKKGSSRIGGRRTSVRAKRRTSVRINRSTGYLP